MGPSGRSSRALVPAATNAAWPLDRAARRRSKRIVSAAIERISHYIFVTDFFKVLRSNRFRLVQFYFVREFCGRGRRYCLEKFPLSGRCKNADTKFQES